MSDRVPAAPLRGAFLRSGLSGSELARRLGWYCPNSSRAKRALGLLPHRGRYADTVPYDTAVAVADALGLDPHEAGV